MISGSANSIVHIFSIDREEQADYAQNFMLY